MRSAVPDIIKKRVFVYASYFNILFFFEIINLMFLLLIIYGKIISITAGGILSVLLSLQIINLYFRKETSRKIQLFLMDIHAAYSIAFIINFIFSNNEPVAMDYFFVLLRFLIACFDIIFILALSDYGKKTYKITGEI